MLLQIKINVSQIVSISLEISNLKSPVEELNVREILTWFYRILS